MNRKESSQSLEQNPMSGREEQVTNQDHENLIHSRHSISTAFSSRTCHTHARYFLFAFENISECLRFSHPVFVRTSNLLRLSGKSLDADGQCEYKFSDSLPEHPLSHPILSIPSIGHPQWLPTCMTSSVSAPLRCVLSSLTLVYHIRFLLGLLPHLRPGHCCSTSASCSKAYVLVG